MLFSPEGLDPKLIVGVAVYPFPRFVIFISETAPTTATTSSSFPEPTILTIGGSSGSYPLPLLVIDILSISPSYYSTNPPFWKFQSFLYSPPCCINSR